MINTIKQKRNEMENNHLKYKLLSTDWCCFPFYHFDLSVIRSTAAAHIGNKKLGIYIEYHETETEKESNFALLFWFSLQLATSNCKTLKFTISSFDCSILKHPNKKKTTSNSTFLPKEISSIVVLNQWRINGRRTKKKKEELHMLISDSQ